MSIRKSEITLSTQTLLPIIQTDDNFSYFSKEPLSQHFFSNLLCATDFSRVMSILHRLALKKEPISCICHLRQKNLPSLLVLLNGKVQNNQLHITLYDVDSLDETTLKEITYQKLYQINHKEQNICLK